MNAVKERSLREWLVAGLRDKYPETSVRDYLTLTDEFLEEANKQFRMEEIAWFEGERNAATLHSKIRRAFAENGLEQGAREIGGRLSGDNESFLINLKRSFDDEIIDELIREYYMVDGQYNRYSPAYLIIVMLSLAPAMAGKWK